MTRSPTRPTTARPADAARAGAPRPPASHGWAPFHLLPAVVVAAGCVKLAGPLLDTNDVFWHVALGSQVLDGTGFDRLGAGWSFTVADPGWRTTMWAGELLLAWLYSLGGWPALVWFRIACFLLVALVLAAGALRRFPARVAGPAVAVTLAFVAIHLQERPQALSWVGVALLGVWLQQLLDDGALPLWPWPLALAVGWANVHGLWVLLPAVLLLGAAARLIDHGRGDHAARRAGLLAVGTTLAGCLTPLGPAGLTAPLEVRAAAAPVIVEWQPTAPVSLVGVGLLLTLVAGVVGWLRGSSRSRGRLLVLVVLGTLGWTAARNVVPTMLLLTPVVVALLSEAAGRGADSPVTRREAQVVRAVAVGVVLAGVGLTGALVVTQPATADQVAPARIAAALATTPGPVRVLNDFEASGIIVLDGGDAQVAVDGRTDYYGASFLTRYVEALATARGLDPLVAELRPTHAVLEHDSVAADRLVDLGWLPVTTDAGYVLLAAP